MALLLFAACECLAGERQRGRFGRPLRLPRTLLHAGEHPKHRKQQGTHVRDPATTLCAQSRPLCSLVCAGRRAAAALPQPPTLATRPSVMPRRVRNRSLPPIPAADHPHVLRSLLLCFSAAGCPGTGWAGPLSGLPLPAATDRRTHPLQKMPDQGETTATQHSSTIGSTSAITCAGIVRAGAAPGLLPCRRPSRCPAAPPIPRDTPPSARRGQFLCSSRLLARNRLTEDCSLTWCVFAVLLGLGLAGQHGCSV